MKETITCPFCEGTGTITIKKRSVKNITIDNMDKIKLGNAISYLRKQGLTYREICKVIDVNHPQKVKHYEGYKNEQN